MPESLAQFFAWYLVPWQRIGRKEFGIALALATLPGILLMVVGFGQSASGFLGPLLSLGSAGNAMSSAVNGGNVADVQSQMNTLSGTLGSLGGAFSGSGTAAATGFAVDWVGVLNNGLLLALLPLTRMRLRDIGWFGNKELVTTLVLNVSVAHALLGSLTGWDILPLSWLWATANFVGYIWLSMAKGQPRLAVHERTAYQTPQPPQPQNPWRGTDDDHH